MTSTRISYVADWREYHHAPGKCEVRIGRVVPTSGAIHPHNAYPAAEWHTVASEVSISDAQRRHAEIEAMDVAAQARLWLDSAPLAVSRGPGTDPYWHETRAQAGRS